MVRRDNLEGGGQLQKTNRARAIQMRHSEKKTQRQRWKVLLHNVQMKMINDVLGQPVWPFLRLDKPPSKAKVHSKYSDKTTTCKMPVAQIGKF